MEKIKNKGGRPKKENPRTIISEVYLTPDEAEELRVVGKLLAIPYLSQFLRAAAFSFIKQQSLGLDAKSASIAAQLGSLSSDISSLHHIASQPGMPEAAFILSGAAQDKIRNLNKYIHSKQ